MANRLPALAGVVITQNEIALSAVTGVRAWGRPEPALISDRFHLGSCTKAMTATLGAIAIDERALTWETSAGEIARGTELAAHSGWDRVTLRHLLCHQGGVEANVLEPGGWTFRRLRELGGTPAAQREAYLTPLLSAPPARTPGTGFFYSNTGYIIAGWIIEHALRGTWEELVQRRVFAPLGIRSAGFGPVVTTEDPAGPWPHRWTPDGGPELITELRWSDNPPVYGPAGLVHMTVPDWAAFVRDQIRTTEGAGALVSRETGLDMFRDPFEGRYAAGWGIRTFDHAPLGRGFAHAGSNTANFALALVALEGRAAALVVTNAGGPTQRLDELCMGAARAALAEAGVT